MFGFSFNQRDIPCCDGVICTNASDGCDDLPGAPDQLVRGTIRSCALPADTAWLLSVEDGENVVFLGNQVVLFVVDADAGRGGRGRGSIVDRCERATTGSRSKIQTDSTIFFILDYLFVV